MADQPISGLATYPASPTSATGTSADEIEFLDVNDTSMAATGTNKRVNMADFFSTFITAGANITVTKQTTGGGVSIAGSASGLTIGNAVSGGGTNRVLFEDGSSNLATSANLMFDGTTVTLPGGATAANVSGTNPSTWINIPTTGSGGIGSGGIGVNPWMAYAFAAGNWFSDTNTGDICIRNSTNPIRLGIGAGVTFLKIANQTAPLAGVTVQALVYNRIAMSVFGYAAQTAPLVTLGQVSSLPAQRNCGYIDATFNTSTDASWSGNLLLYAGDYTSTNAGKRLGVQIQSDGTQALVGFFGATPVAKPTGDIGTALTNLGLVTTPATSTITVDTPSAGAVTCNLATSNWHQITFAANTTITLSNVGTNQQFTLIIIQGGSGSYNVTFSGMTIKWPGGAAPTLTTAVGGIDVLTFKQISAGNYYGFVAGAALA